ncbi:MAG: cysteine desulfurase [Candidatus Bathyarchaeota archaeon]|nr:MAG: cysteine desulfurase [Candidatus Bathyarchaeota archaeon]
MQKVYLDNAATTPTDPRVLEAMLQYFADSYGNASSMNSFGKDAKEALEESRRKIADFMNADPEELIFTGSATEANNLILKGHAFGAGKRHCHIAVSTIDHDCVLNTVKWLEKQGFRISYLPVDSYGLLRIDPLQKVLEEDVTLVSVVHGNNEIGTVQNIKKIAKMCHENGSFFHTDAVQSFGKLPIDVELIGIDSMTINAHKMYGPKGVGALYIDRTLKITPLIHGGSHEFGKRAGTENIPSIVGFAKAVELREREMDAEGVRLCRLRDRLIRAALEIEDTYLNVHPTKRLPNNVSLRFSHLEGEAIVLDLDAEGIAASSGSACSTKSNDPSHVLLAIGLRPQEARGSLRLSLGKKNSAEEIEFTAQQLAKVVERLRGISPLTHLS